LPIVSAELPALLAMGKGVFVASRTNRLAGQAIASLVVLNSGARPHVAEEGGEAMKNRLQVLAHLKTSQQS
jgi:hypothetical protein